MSQGRIKILDTTIADAGPAMTISDQFLKSGLPLRMHCDLGAGDVVKIQGRAGDADTWDTLHTFSDETPVDIFPSKFIRAFRSTDGASADSYIYVYNQYDDVVLTTHTA